MLALMGFIIAILLVGSSQSGGARCFCSPQAPLCVVDSVSFEEGDILLRRGNSFISSMIVQAFPHGGGMSHCGILLKRQGTWKVVHSISGRISDLEGIRIEPLMSFVEHARDGEVKHIKPLFAVKRERIKQESLRLLAQKLPFDHEFNLNDPSKMYCSELVRAVYLAGTDQDPFIYKEIGGKALIDMASFFWRDMWQEL